VEWSVWKFKQSIIATTAVIMITMMTTMIIIRHLYITAEWLALMLYIQAVMSSSLGPELDRGFL
jgi:isocitrate dehydrogenase kinase/phosphatase